MLLTTDDNGTRNYTEPLLPESETGDNSIFDLVVGYV